MQTSSITPQSCQVVLFEIVSILMILMLLMLLLVIDDNDTLTGSINFYLNMRGKFTTGVPRWSVSCTHPYTRLAALVPSYLFALLYLYPLL